MTSIHYLNDRFDREECIKSIGGYGKVIDSFVVDKGHVNGPEIHEITDNAIIKVYNQRTHKFVTALIARPGQIYRYYEEGKAPKNVVDKARKHTQLGLNFR